MELRNSRDKRDKKKIYKIEPQEKNAPTNVEEFEAKQGKEHSKDCMNEYDGGTRQ